jgi:hypothetical protein
MNGINECMRLVDFGLPKAKTGKIPYFASKIETHEMSFPGYRYISLYGLQQTAKGDGSHLSAP